MDVVWIVACLINLLVSSEYRAFWSLKCLKYSNFSSLTPRKDILCRCVNMDTWRNIWLWTWWGHGYDNEYTSDNDHEYTFYDYVDANDYCRRGTPPCWFGCSSDIFPSPSEIRSKIRSTEEEGPRPVEWIFPLSLRCSSDASPPHLALASLSRTRQCSRNSEVLSQSQSWKKETLDGVLEQR